MVLLSLIKFVGCLLVISAFIPPEKVPNETCSTELKTCQDEFKKNVNYIICHAIRAKNIGCVFIPRTGYRGKILRLVRAVC